MPDAPSLPLSARAAILLRLFAVQGSWNYETMLGNGIAFALEPALRRLPGGAGGEAYRAAMAREARYFNAHPYLAALAVGALARVELEQVPPAQIERFRGALCGPLGSVGDQLFWAGWLPCCSAIALLGYGLGAGPGVTAALFLAPYTVGHIAMRVWGLESGWRAGLRVAGSLAQPLLREAPRRIAAATLVLLAFALPLVAARIMRAGTSMPVPLALAAIGVAALVMGVALVLLKGRVEGWKAAIAALALLVIYSVVR
jgi:PTS system mannose-specific IID component